MLPMDAHGAYVFYTVTYCSQERNMSHNSQSSSIRNS
jgi:hypothetical protein